MSEALEWTGLSVGDATTEISWLGITKIIDWYLSLSIAGGLFYLALVTGILGSIACAFALREVFTAN